MSFDLSAYLARITLKEAPAADAAGLAAVQRAHRLTIPFENLDLFLGRPISLERQAIFAKLVARSRGGYCFEQNGLFRDALTALGFAVRPLLARVWLGASEVPPKTHTLNLVTIDGQDWIADAGFGGSDTPPMPLGDGAMADSPDGARHRLRRDADHGWMLEREGHAALTDGRGMGDGWMPQYSFTLDRVWPADLAMSNHFTSTVPGGRFTTFRIVSIILPSGFASMTDRHYSRRNGERASVGEIADARTYRLRLSLMFGLQLSADEIAGLRLFG